MANGAFSFNKNFLIVTHNHHLSCQLCCCSPAWPAMGTGPETAAGRSEVALCTHLLSSCQLWSTSSACSTCTGSSCLCLSHTVGWTWEEMGNTTWSNQPGICGPLTLSSPKSSPRPPWAPHCTVLEKSQRFVRNGLNQLWLGPVLPLPHCCSCQAGRAAASDHPPCRDWDGFGCENTTATQVVLW